MPQLYHVTQNVTRAGSIKGYALARAQMNSELSCLKTVDTHCAKISPKTTLQSCLFSRFKRNTAEISSEELRPSTRPSVGVDRVRMYISRLSASPRLHAGWRAFVAASIPPTLFMVIYLAAFDARTIWMLVLVYASDITYLVSVIERLAIKFKERSNLNTSHYRKIIYVFKGPFLLDFLSMLPLEAFAYIMLSVGEDATNLLGYLYLNRCFRGYRTWIYLCKNYFHHLLINLVTQIHIIHTFRCRLILFIRCWYFIHAIYYT